MSSVFLSYDREDSGVARHFARALEKAGHEVWWDLHIKTGAQYTKEIDQALKAADAVVVLWSKRSVESAWVRDEAAAGRDSGRLVPVAIDGTEPPLGFRQFQTINLSQWKGRGKPVQLQVLLDDVASMGGAEATSASAVEATKQAPGAASSAVSRRSVLIAGGGMAILAASGAAMLAWRQEWFGPADTQDHSIAVLPFKALGGDPAQAYFSDGIAEEIRAALRRIPSLRVLARTSSSLAAEGGGGTIAIARKLKVAYLLDGSVQVAGNTLRIGVDLADGRTGFSKWSDQVDRPLTDIFAVQQEIARTVADAMAAQIATAKPEVGGTRSVAAYQYYLRARQAYFESNSPDDERATLTLLDLALAADPGFAKAHALRSRTLTRLAAGSGSQSEARSFGDQGLQTAKDAIRLAPRLAEAHLALSFAREIRLDFRAAQTAIQRAMQLAPGDADVLRTYSNHVLNLGQVDAARRAATKAVSLDPLNHVTHTALANVEFGARRFRTAIDHYRNALSLGPDGGFSHAQLGLSLMFVGDTTEALNQAQKEPLPWMRQMALAIIRRELGDRSGAAREFDQLKEMGPLVSYQMAQVLAQWRDREGALSALRRAVEVRDPGISHARTDPLLIPLHGDARYSAILRQVGLV